MSLGRRCTLVGLFVIAASMPAEARADDVEKRACIDAHLDGQKLRDAGKLRAARQQFLSCGVEACPAPLRKDCMSWLNETESLIPTVIFEARRTGGTDPVDLKVTMDGEPLADRLTGMPVPVDPGEHQLRFVAPDGRVREQRLFVTASEKNLRVRVDFSANKPAEPAADAAQPATGRPAPDGERAGVPPSALVLAGVGLVALGSAAVFGVSALTRGRDLEKTCAPTCATSDAEAVHQSALVADVSLGVGLLALGAAAWIFFDHRAGAAPRSAVVVAPTSHGSLVGWRATF